MKESENTNSTQPLRNILITVCISLMAVVSSVSGLNVAQSMLAAEFNCSQNTVLWIINSYTLTLAALLLPLGALGDRKGRKKILLTGLIIFGTASILSGVSTGAVMMLITRFLTGIGAAMIMPVTLAVITATFPPKERSKAIGIWTGVAGGGSIIGMYLSALLVDISTWRWLFLLPTVLAGTAVVMAVRYVPDSIEKNTQRFDSIGSLLSIVATIAIIYALHELPATGVSEPFVIGSLILGILSVIGFIIWELHHKAPLLDVRLFRDKSLLNGTVTLLIVFGVQAGIFIVLFPFFQSVLGWSGLLSTVALLPMAALMLLSSALAPKLALRAGIKKTTALGIGLGALGTLLMATLVSAETGYLSVLPGLIAIGLGMGFSMTPSTEAITSSLSSDNQGIASALNDITREFGTALGVALLGPLVAAGYSSAITEKLNGFSESVILNAKKGFVQAQMIAPGTGNKSDTLIRMAKSSFVEGWQQAMWVGSVILLLLLAYTLFSGTKTRKKTPADTPSDAQDKPI